MKMYDASHPGMTSVHRRMFSILGWIIFAIAAGVFMYAGLQIVGIVSEDAKANNTTSAMQGYTSGAPDAMLALNELTAQADADQPLTEEEIAVMDAAAVEAGENDDFQIDFAGLQQTAPDTRAWIRIPDTNINHPVMQGRDNEEYLKKSPDGSANRSGSIFMDYRCHTDFTDRNTILYGHRMNNNTMFAQLHKFEDKTFRATHPYIYVNLPDGTVLTYRIFAVYVPGNLLSGHPYQVAWMSDQDFVDWAQAERQRPYYFDSTQLFSPQDHIITLSTCVRGDGGKRFIVQGRLISHTFDNAAPAAA